MADVFLRANTGATKIEVSALVSTTLVRKAAQAHDIRGTSAVALGRLLSATALVGLSSRRPGVTSIQVLSQSRIGQVFADVTEEGWLRGYVKNTALNYPIILSEDLLGRRTIGPAVAPGQISVVRMGERGEYTQSATPLADGEIDSDVDYFLNQSDQVASILRCDTLMDKHGDIVTAGGLLIRALPDSSMDAMHELRELVHGRHVEDLLRQGAGAEALLRSVTPEGSNPEPAIYPVWRCRCSKEKVLATLYMLDVMEITQMVAADEPVEVRCELCNTLHRVDVPELESMMQAKVPSSTLS